MDWNMMDPMGSFYWLGEFVGEFYEPADDCIDVLNTIIQDLDEENVQTYDIRRRMFIDKTLENDLIPLLRDCHDPDIFDKNLRILVTLIQPVQPTSSPNADLIGAQLIQLVNTAKYLCSDVGIIKAVEHRLNTILSQESMDQEATEVVNLCILLLRNLFHLVPSATTNSQSMILHKCLVSSFFINEMDRLILSLLNHKLKKCWTVGLTQLISFIFKHYSSSLLEPNIDDVADSNPSSSSSRMQSGPLQSSNQNLTGDFEDKLQLQSRSGKSDEEDSEEAFMLEFTTTEDGKIEVKLTSCPMRKSGSSTEESSSKTSGNGEDMDVGESLDKDPLRQSSSDSKTSSKEIQDAGSPCCLNEVEEELISSNIHSAATLIDQDILVSYLKKFATDLMDSRFVNLVENIMTCILTEYTDVLDHSFIMWTVGFFLSFANQHDLDVNCYKDVLNLDLFGFLVYEGVVCCESLNAKCLGDGAVEKHRLHLIVCTLNQMFRALLANKTVDGLSDICKSLGQVSQLPNLFVLMVKCFMPSEQTTVYLRDIVQTNHVLMLMLEEWISLDFIGKHTGFDLLDHVKQFATKDIMAKYGSLLDSTEVHFDGLLVSVMTMMYHVAGNCGRQDTLIQPPVMLAFLNLWADESLKNCDELNDLVEFIMELFMSTVERDPKSCSNLYGFDRAQIDEMQSAYQHRNQNKQISMHSECDFNAKHEDLSEEEQSLLLSWVSGLKGPRLVEKLTDRLAENGFTRTNEQVYKFLSLQGIMNTEMKADLKNKFDDDETSLFSCLSKLEDEEIVPCLIEWLKNKGFGTQICWVQKQLLETAYVKLTLQDSSMRIYPEEPVQKFSAIQKKDVPLVPWNEEIAKALNEPAFQLLLCHLGLTTPEEGSDRYCRIPADMSFTLLLETAQTLGSIETLPLKFDPLLKHKSSDIGDVHFNKQSNFGEASDAMTNFKTITQGSTERRNTNPADWLNFVKKNNTNRTTSK